MPPNNAFYDVPLGFNNVEIWVYLCLTRVILKTSGEMPTLVYQIL